MQFDEEPALLEIPTNVPANCTLSVEGVAVFACFLDFRLVHFTEGTLGLKKLMIRNRNCSSGLHRISEGRL